MTELRIGDITRLTGRAAETIRRFERTGRIPRARRQRRWRYWRQEDLPAVYAGLGVAPPSTLEESLARILDGTAMPDTLDGLCEYLSPAMAKAVEGLLGQQEVKSLLKSTAAHSLSRES